MWWRPTTFWNNIKIFWFAGIPYEYALKLYRKPDDIRILGGCGHPNQLNGLSPTSYHIDTWQGLKFFADTLKEIKDNFNKKEN